MEATWLNFQDDGRNPLIEPPRGTWLLGDPSVLAPEQTPDGRWHLFANTVTGIRHFVSADGFAWQQEGPPVCKGIRACVRCIGDEYFLYYEHFRRLWHTVVALRRSRNLNAWSEPEFMLEPCFRWEGRLPRTNGNPCLVEASKGYRLYFSANVVVLWDTAVLEPRHIGVATAEHPAGPWRKHPTPLFSPDPTDPFMNLGAGAIKVYREGEEFIGLQNGIYRDQDGRSRSAIRLLRSEDGLAWRLVRAEPILQPEAGTWKHALVYALEVVRRKDEFRLYYNARDGWLIGRERIGVARSARE
jgi:hypothetical protein